MLRIQAVFTLLGLTLAPAQESSPRLVPRPIPGMTRMGSTGQSQASQLSTPSQQLTQPAAERPQPQTTTGSLALSPVSEPARILFVHRRNQLPAAMRQRLKALPAAPAETEAANPSGAVELLQERPAALRIIPKSEVPLLKTPAAATPQTEAMKP